MPAMASCRLVVVASILFAALPGLSKPSIEIRPLAFQSGRRSLREQRSHFRAQSLLQPFGFVLPSSSIDYLLSAVNSYTHSSKGAVPISCRVSGNDPGVGVVCAHQYDQDSTDGRDNALRLLQSLGGRPVLGGAVLEE